MEHYITELIWLATWPTLIFLTYKFVRLNINQLAKLEKEESYEKNMENQ